MANSSTSGSRAQIEAAKQQVKESQAQIESSRGEISAARQSIKPRKRVPFTPRKERLGREQYKRTLSAAEKKLIEQESELLKYKKETLDPADKKLAEVEEYNIAVERINRAIDKGMVWAHAAYGKGLMRKLAKQYLKRRSIERRYAQKQEAEAAPEYVDPLGQGVSYDPIAAGDAVDYYKKSIPAYYDPIAGKEVLQSMDPAIAARQGYIPVELKGYKPSTGQYIIESKTGLLTPSQLAYKSLIDQAKRQTTEIPTTFEIGGAPTKQRQVDLLQTPTQYEVAARAKPYAGKEFSKIELQRLGSKGFYEKYGYSVDSSGQPLYSGAAGGVINVGPTREEGESFAAWYKRSLKDPASTRSAVSLATLGTGARLGATAVKKIGTSVGAVFSEPIATGTAEVVDLIVPRSTSGFAPSGIPRQVARGALFTGAVLVPGVGAAFGTEIAKGAATDPLGTGQELVQYARESPYEVGTMAAFGLSRARRFRLDKKAAKLVEKNIKKLSEAKVTDITLIRRGRGVRPGTDRVAIEAVQELPDAVRKIKIEGDLLTLKEKIYFVPDAKGYATTVTLVKPSRLARGRVYQDVQVFEVGGKSSGINLGNIGDIQLYTPLGYSTYVPLKSTSALVKRKFGPYAEARTLAEVTRQLESATPQYGGQVIKDVTLPFEDLGFKINEQVSLLTGQRGTSLILTTAEAQAKFRARGRGVKQRITPKTQIESLPTLKFKDLIYKGKNLGDIKINTITEMNTLRRFIYDLGYKKFPSDVFVVEGLKSKPSIINLIEPQVFDALVKLERKGFKTVSSGFTPQSMQQHIVFRGELSNNFASVAKKYNLKVSRTGNQIELSLNQKGKSLRDTANIFKKFAEEVNPVSKGEGVGVVKTDTLTGALVQEQIAAEQRVVPVSKVAKNVARQSENIVSSLVPVAETRLTGIPRMTGGEGLTEQQQVRYQQPSNMLVSYDVSPGLDIRDVSKAQAASGLLVPLARTEVQQRGRQLTESKAQQKFRQLEKQRQIERTKQIEKLRQREKQRQQQVQKQMQKQAQKVGNILGIPTLPRIGFELDPVTGRPRKKVRVKKKKVSKKKKKKERKVLPTLSQQILGINLGRRVERPTGFEIARV